MKKIITLIAVVISFASYAQVNYNNVKDHEIVGRYLDSRVTSHRIEETGKLNYALSPKRDGHWSVFKQFGTARGKVTTIEYEAPPGSDLNEVHSYYEKILKNKGFKFLFRCKGDACKDDVYSVGQTLVEGDYIKRLSRDIWRGFFDNSSYIAAQKKTIDYIITATFLASMEEGKSVHYRLEITDTENLDLPVSDIKNSLDKDGKIALYNIYFEDKDTISTIQPKSKRVVSSLAKYLKANPGINVLIVGHTDNAAKFDRNFNLSQTRAECVADELVNNHQISPSRITPFGVGMLSPVTSNDSEKGRRLNNRVEIVKR